MSYERYLSPEQKISRVEQIVSDNPEVAGLQAYEYFRNNSASQKAAFISGERESLELSYPELSDENIARLAEPAHTALRTMMPGERSAKSEALYRSVEYRYSELFMMQTAKELQEKDHGPAKRKELLDWFREANENLYGTPSLPVFRALAKRHLFDVMNNVGYEQPVAYELAYELRSRVGGVPETDYQPFKASPTDIEKIGSLVHERYGALVSHIDPDKTYEPAEMKIALEEAVIKSGGAEQGWRAELVATSDNLAVSAHQKLVEVGAKREALDGKVLRGKVLHEVGVHAQRSINAEKAGWLSAAYGQDGYLDFEEALGLAFEDAYAGKFNEMRGVEHYLVAGLAYGLDSHEERDFREVYEVMWRTKALRNLNGEDVTEDKIAASKDEAFKACMRLFRGTTTQDKGIVYLKDLSYFRGKELTWSVLSRVNTQADLDLLLAGKLDLTQPDHLEIAKQIRDTNQ